VEEGLLAVYREEFPEDKNDKGFDDWLEKQGGKNGQAHGELENLAYAAVGENVDDKEWLGIKDAYRVSEVYGQGDGEFIIYKDCLVDISDLEYYDEDYGDYFTYQQDPQGFEAYYVGNPEELIDQLNSRVEEIMSESTMYEEGFKDVAKAGWNKVKSGAKKVGKAIGDVFKGPFRKGDHIVMQGEDGEEFKGTIKDFDLGEKTYEVMLGNAVNEGSMEEVLEMPDRVNELEEEIDKLWRRLGDVDDKTLCQLICKCVELEQMEPGRLIDQISDYSNGPF